MKKSLYPICEFDSDRNALIRASDFLPRSLPARCVITFFRRELERLVQEYRLPVIGRLHSEVVDLPIYSWKADGQDCCIALPFPTAPGAASTLEELHAMGCEKFIVCGGAGCIGADLPLGDLILPASALRDEGTSYHYLPPAREVHAPEKALQTVKKELDRMGIRYLTGKTWTTDAIYRETPAAVALRREEGCLTVEMEAAAFFAVSKYYGLSLAQILYAGDDVSGPSWDPRDWDLQKGVRENLISLGVRLVHAL